MVKENQALKFGYVIVVSGKAKGRIGRYMDTDRDTGHSKVCFGYEKDHLPYAGYQLFSPANLSSDITKQDLADRYFAIVNDLRKIDVRGHSKIKKYTADHTSLITECNIVRGLLNAYLSVRHLSRIQFESNTVLFTSFQDVLWYNDFAVDLETRKAHVAVHNHELRNEHNTLVTETALDLCRHFIFVLSKYSVRSSWLASDLRYIKSKIDTDRQAIHFVSIDETPAPSQLKDSYDLTALYSPRYDSEFNRLICALDL